MTDPARPAAPDVRVLAVDEAARSLRIEVVPELACFDGHFPGRPVLPGIVQLQWAIEQAQAAWDELGAPLQIANLKFVRPVAPPATLELSLARVNAERVDFTFQNGDDRKLGVRRSS